MEKKLYTVDLTSVTDRKDLHRLLRETFADRDYDGNNLDALYDMLTSFGIPARITVRGFTEAEKTLGEYAERFRLALFYAADDNGDNLQIEVGEDPAV